MAYYKRLRDLREDRDLTQKDIAEELYMQTTQYRRYETGERSLSLETAVALAEFYNVSLDYLAELTDYNGKIETSELSVDEKQLLTYFRKLNSTDKERLLERAMTLCENKKDFHKKPGLQLGLFLRPADITLFVLSLIFLVFSHFFSLTY